MNFDINSTFVIKRLAILFLGATAFLSCSNNNEDHSAHIDQLFIQLDTASLQNMQPLHAKLDSAVAHHKLRDIDKGKYYRLKGWYNFHIKNFEKAIAYDDSAIALSRKKMNQYEFSDLYMSSLAHKGDIYAELRRYDEALTAYAQAKLVYTNLINDSCAISIYDSRIANILYFLRRYVKAAHYYRQAYEIRERCSSAGVYPFVEIQMNMDNTGLAYFGAGMLDSAEYFYKKAEAYIDSNKHKYPQKDQYIALAKAVIVGNIGNLREKQGRYEEALPMLQSSIQGTRNDEPYYAITPQIALAKLYIKTFQPQAAENAVKDLERSAKYVGEGNNRVLYLEVLKDYYAQRGNQHLAGAYDEAYQSAKDSLDKFTMQAMDHDFAQDFENREQKGINDYLLKENELKRFQLMALILLVVTGTGLVLFILYHLRKSAGTSGY